MFIKKSACLLVAATLSLGGLSGCDDRDVAIGVGAVAGAAIGAAIGGSVGGNSGHHHGGYCRGGYQTVCSQTVDRWGNPATYCQPVYRDCLYRDYGRSYFSAESSVFDYADASNFKAEDFSKEFKLNFEAGARILSALKSAKEGDQSDLNKLGLSASDLRELAQFRLPSEEGIQTFSVNLNVHRDILVGMFNRMRAWAMSNMTQACDEARFSQDADKQKFFEANCH
jgi:hypothetical protein